MIRGTSNQTILTIAQHNKCSMYETGADPAPAVFPALGQGGGAGFSQAGSAEYREIDNTPLGETGTHFIPSTEHLPWDTAQVTVQAAPV